MLASAVQDAHGDERRARAILPFPASHCASASDFRFKYEQLSSPNGLARSKISKLILPQSVVLVPKVENFNQNVVMLLKKLN